MAADFDLDDIATRAEGLSGADLAMLCSRATLAVIRHHLAAAGDDAALMPIADADFRQALHEIAAERQAAGLSFDAPVFT